MISTTKSDNVIVHEVSGTVVLPELTQAALRAQDGSLACVVWDFRQASLDPEIVEEFATLIKAGVRAMLEDMTTTKRAFIVAHDRQDNTVSAVLRTAGPPWPWGIFRTMEDALSWVDD